MKVECPECDEEAIKYGALELHTIQRCQELEMMEYIIETQHQRWANCLKEYEEYITSC